MCLCVCFFLHSKPVTNKKRVYAMCVSVCERFTSVSSASRSRRQFGAADFRAVSLTQHTQEAYETHKHTHTHPSYDLESRNMYVCCYCNYIHLIGPDGGSDRGTILCIVN